MRNGTYLLTFAALWAMCHGAMAAAGCPVSAEPQGLVCPVGGGGQVRPGDACAREGGGVNANRGAGRRHNGLDINAPEGTPVYAAAGGRVALASPNWGPLGNTVIIDHGDGRYSVYGHLRVFHTRRNRCVQPGELIGAVGYTGNAQCLRDNGLSSHLHFAVIHAARVGLIDRNGGPLASAIKSNDHWAQFGRKYFGREGLGVQDPEALLAGTPGCLK